MDTSGYYTNDAVWIIDSEDYYLLGILNSKMGWYEISRWCTAIQNGYQLIWNYFKNVCSPEAPADLCEKIAVTAKRCLDAATNHPSALASLEGELNALVYRAYGLDEEDIKVIEGSIGKQNVELVEADELIGDDVAP